MAYMTKPSAESAYDNEGRRKYLSRTEGTNFVRHAAKLPRDKAIFCLTIYYTGCRISEALALRRQDVDSETKTILIRSLKKRDKRQTRRVPIPIFLMTSLLDITPKNGKERFWPISRTTGWRIVKDVMKTAGIVGIHATTKGLRHGFGVRGTMQQIPVTLIQLWMGHADLATTAIYLAVKDEEERELIEKTW